MSRRSDRTAFTLVELLVVISIIAVLISLLLPTLKGVKRQTRVVSCLNNQKQIGIGLMVYVSESNYRFPTPRSIAVTQIWNPATEVPDSGNRQNLIEIAGSTTSSELYFCPFLVLDGYSPDSSTDPSSPYARHFECALNGICGVGYNMFFLAGDAWHSFNFSGNPDLDGNGVADRPAPGYSNAAVMADHNTVNPGDTFAVPTTAVHSRALRVPFQSSNVLYADGHAETHGTLDDTIYVQRSAFTPSIYPY